MSKEISREREIRANKFALELLMPTDIFMKFWNKGKTIEQMAKKFGVSVSHIKTKLFNLGVIV